MTQLSKRTSIFDEMDAVMKTVFSDVFNPEFEKQFKIGLDKATYPKADIIDDGDKLTIEVDVNRLTRKDISVEIHPSEERNVSYLSIRGGKSEDSNAEKRNYIKKEIKRSSWQRSWVLPEKHFEVDSIKADVKDGLLIIEIPKIGDKNPKEVKKLL